MVGWDLVQRRPGVPRHAPGDLGARACRCSCSRRWCSCRTSRSRCSGSRIVAGHNLLDGVEVPPDQQLLWAILHQRDNVAGLLERPCPDLLVLYPLLPWIGVMALGYVLGRAYTLGGLAAAPLLLGLGLATTVGWVVSARSTTTATRRPGRPPRTH